MKYLDSWASTFLRHFAREPGQERASPRAMLGHVPRPKGDLEWTRASDGSEVAVLVSHEGHGTRWERGAARPTVVAGGCVEGPALNQLRGPMGLAVDRDGAIFVAEAQNYRVMRWAPGAGAGTVVAGGRGEGSALNELNVPYGLAVDIDGAFIVVDAWNYRVMRWAPGAGTVVAGGRSQGSTLNQLRGPIGVAVDRDGAITVADAQNLSVFCGPTFARSPHLHT